MEQAVAGAVALLRTTAKADGRDWAEVTAGRLEWDCHRTAVHLAQALLTYSGRLAGRTLYASRPFNVTVDEGTATAELLDVVEAAGRLLTATLRATPREVRAFHPFPFRSANREGFAAMGVAEVLLHTHDIAEGLGAAYEPPAELAEYVLTGIFPHVQPGPAPWPTLLWATGRGELPGRAPVTDWRWSNNLVIPTDRLTLEGVTPAVAADLAVGGDGGFRWPEGGPFEGTQDAAGMVLKAYEAGVHRPEWGLFVLVRRTDGLAVGGLGFHGAPDEDGRAEIGYDLVESARGNGYATEALRALSEWALARDDVRTLCAAIEADNASSQRVIARAGFIRADLEDERAAHVRHGREERDEGGEGGEGLRLYVLRAGATGW